MVKIRLHRNDILGPCLPSRNLTVMNLYVPLMFKLHLLIMLRTRLMVVSHDHAYGFQGLVITPGSD